MKTSRASKRYAAALLDLAAELKKTEKIGADMRLIRDSMASSRDLQLFFSNPVINRSKKRSVVKSLYEGKIDRMSLDFIYLLIDKGREKLIGGISEQVGILLDEMNGILNAELKAPFELDEKNRARVQSKLEDITGKKVRVSFSLEKNLVGGFLAQIGDTVYDGSVRRQLEILKHRLSEDVSLAG